MAHRRKDDSYVQTWDGEDELMLLVGRWNGLGCGRYMCGKSFGAWIYLYPCTHVFVYVYVYVYLWFIIAGCAMRVSLSFSVCRCVRVCVGGVCLFTSRTYTTTLQYPTTLIPIPILISLVRSFYCLFVRSFVRSFIRSFVHSFVRSWRGWCARTSWSGQEF